MDFKLELLKEGIFDAISEKLSYEEIDLDRIADTTATKALSEIADILADDALSDFDAVEKIVGVFEAHKLSVQGRHDF